MRSQDVCSRFNLIFIVLVLVLDIRILWIARDEYDEVLAQQPRMELHENNIGFSMFNISDGKLQGA